MPTYEYECRECHAHLEAVQSFHDPALSECPTCGGELRKVFSAVGIVFKGSGFYKTDARSATSATSPASTSSDSKPTTPTPAAASTPATTSTD